MRPFHPHIGYVVLFVADLERSIGFYRDRLGMVLHHRAAAYASFTSRGARFSLYTRREAAALIGEERMAIFPQGVRGEVVFWVEEVDSLYEAWSARGVAFLSPPRDRPWGERTAYLEDPDGNLIELCMRLPRSTSASERRVEQEDPAAD